MLSREYEYLKCCAKFIAIIGVCATSCKSQPITVHRFCNDIVIVNTGVNYRIGIAKQLDVINKLNPKVVAIDLQFATRKNPYQDSLLISSLNQCSNLVMACVIDGFTGRDTIYSNLTGTLPEFLTNAKIGYTNAIFEDDEFSTLKRFSVYEKINDLIMYHFAIQSAMQFDSVKTLNFLKNANRLSDVNYIGNREIFQVFSHDDLLGGKVERKDIEGKIVLLGYLGPYDGYKGRLENEDKFFTPLNNKLEPYQPDMYGVVYLANIIAGIVGCQQ